MSTSTELSSPLKPNPFVRLDRIELIVPGGRSTPGENSPPPVATMATTTKCFICANPTDDKKTNNSTQKEQAVLLKTFVKSASPEISEENSTKKNEGEATTTTCPACDVAMTTVWNLHRQMVAVLKQIDDVVKLVRDTMPMLKKAVKKEEEESELIGLTWRFVTL